MNIFVTVGAQIPFDRLIAAVDAWAAGRAGGQSLFAQVGEKGIRPVNMESVELLEPPAKGWARVRHQDGNAGYVRAAEVWGL